MSTKIPKKLVEIRKVDKIKKEPSKFKEKLKKHLKMSKNHQKCRKIRKI